VKTQGSLRAAALLGLWLAPAGLCARPEAWVPARWEGGPLEAARRAREKTPPSPEVRDALARWYEPATLNLLENFPANCLLLTFSAGADAAVEERQRQLVKEYARAARGRGIAVLGLVYPGADASEVAAAAAGAQLDGLVLEGEFPEGAAFAERLENALRANGGAAVVIPLGPPSYSMWNSRSPVWAVEGVLPGVKAADNAAASATAGMWIDSNMWLVRSLRAAAGRRPVWISHRARAASRGTYATSIADASAAGGRWIVALDDDLRVKLRRGDGDALAEWRGAGQCLRFFEERANWRDFAPFGNVAIILDPAAPDRTISDEYLNLVARRQIPYRVIYRSQLDEPVLRGLRAALAFDLSPPSEKERKVLSAFAAGGGLVLSGPAWGGAPKDQTYTVVAVGQGEVVVYKDDPPDPETVARDLNDLLPTPDLGVSVFKGPSVLSYVSTGQAGRRMLIQLVNYATAPAEGLTIWVEGEYESARLQTADGPPAEIQIRKSGSRTEVTVPSFGTYGAVELQ
jgi:hypothetical protein